LSKYATVYKCDLSVKEREGERKWRRGSERLPAVKVPVQCSFILLVEVTREEGKVLLSRGEKLSRGFAARIIGIRDKGCITVKFGFSIGRYAVRLNFDE
jgi:hypothetical protein